MRLIRPFLLTISWLAVFAIADETSKQLPAGFKETVYTLPKGDGPHDVAPAPDGKVWYTAQHAGALGILDPETAEVTHVPLGKGSKPHGVIQGPNGNAWITDSGLNAIVRYNPKTGEVKTWTLPESTGYANLNTATFDSEGRLWFTGQSGIYGSLTPKTGRLRTYPAPKKRGPYGIATTPSGMVFYASLAGSYIAHIESETGEVTVIEPPTANQGARRVWSDSKNHIWVSEWNVGNLSRYNPESGEWKTWKLPGKRPQAYAVYVDEKDRIWVSDFGGNRTWIFDAEKGRFVGSVKGSGDYANVRQILGRDGEVWLPESGLDRLMRVAY